MKIIQEFKEFAVKGNVFDMAVGVITGTAFSKVVSSLVQDIIMPPIGVLVGKVKFENLSWTMQPEIKDARGEVVQELVALKYGAFLQVAIDFIVITLSIFVVVKLFNRVRAKAENVKDKSESTPKNIELLAEIRDLLKETNQK
tara:strand:- start:673 stop:1101 length:429 start_codon:yes stop_codon:yes gene_type:complete